MAITYATALSRTRTFVMDSGSTIWPDADLQSAIRFALQEIGLQAGQAFTLSGLDSASATTLPTLLEGALILGAGAYAAASRALDHAELYELADETENVKAWADKMIASFKSQLARMYPPDQARLASLKGAVAPPWGGWEDDFGEREES